MRVEKWVGRTVVKTTKLDQLLELATFALAQEDKRMACAFAARGPKEAFYTGCAHGLAYWVFEHNLVYPIFLRWLEAGFNVLWDEQPTAMHPTEPRSDGSQVSRERSTDNYQQKKRAQFIDLQVLLNEGERWFFEAKWWQVHTTKANDAVGNDLRKLTSLLKEWEGRAFILAFWYGDENSLVNDIQAAQAGMGGLVYLGLFRSNVWRYWATPKVMDEGYFALAAFEVCACASSAGSPP
ncbi:MAG TPA: hypothetical protein PLI95_15650 [Polyangiaceae bacterium]|nr:hypothetical protein [Polyangiaceae bacterium]